MTTAGRMPRGTRSNLGRTRLRVRPRRGDAMAVFDALPADLRRWLASASLPWSPRSVARAFAGALGRTGGDRPAALARLSAIEQRLLATDKERRLLATDEGRRLLVTERERRPPDRARPAGAGASRPRTGARPRAR
ncbi:MAG: DUF6525 family protein [Paracoccaceae bacterium]